MIAKTTSMLLRGALAALVLSAVFAGSAGAAPAWKFEGESLEGTETVVGGAEDSTMSISGLVTDCEHFLYNLSIQNNEGTGEGEVVDLPLYDCGTDSEYCTVDSIEAEELPWASNLTTVSSKHYIVIEGIRVAVLYGGAECALSEILVPVTGSAGGLIDNTTESATFDSASFSATGTKLKAFGQTVQWNGFFPTEAFEWHREEALTVS